MALELALIQEKYGLTEQQVRMAFKYVEGGSLRDAANSAGLSEKEATKLLFENLEWRKCVTDLINVILVDDMVKARAVVRKMMEDTGSDKVRLDAAKQLWDRAAGEPLKRVAHEEATDLSKIAAAITRLAGELGIRPPIDVKVERIDTDGRSNTTLQTAATPIPDRQVRHTGKREPDVVVQPRQEIGPNPQAA